MTEVQRDKIRESVRKNYKEIALSPIQIGSCCAPSCCEPEQLQSISIEEVSKKMGYTVEELSSIPNGANMGLGCGNPQAIADLKEGETVLDLGSGGGFDCFLAAPKVGFQGKVIGVDMTPEMITKARLNAEKPQFQHVEFRLGEIEHLPVADSVVDVIISNCVINLSPNKEQVFKEAYRVLKNGGRLAISDIVLTTELPVDMKQNMELYSGCVAGASSIQELEIYLEKAGFHNIQITPKDESKEFIREWAPGQNVEEYIVSAVIGARK
ncbi:arsenite methyltransferase [Metabacillus fastidiosus]|uniref:arsenite methyltransferase n=1 Tax=Metabacillus fastidiosus TaxID=1458 RepID=UPI002E1F737C|nr:arsenite methyltransferase [Metabacillus fastidiosus]